MSKKTIHKVRMTVTAVLEYELNPEYYPEEIRDDPLQMLAKDVESAEEDVFLFLDSTTTNWLPVKGELLPTASGLTTDAKTLGIQG